MYTLTYRSKHDNRRLKMTVSAGYLDETIMRLEAVGHHVLTVENRLLGRKER